MVAYRRAECIGNGMAGHLALLRLLYRFAPPPQANGAEVGLAHLLGDTSKFDIEGVKGKEIVARVTRGKQGSERPLRIACAGDASYRVAALGLMQS
jgi:hypothetical protein